jgi:hypothetical protein
MSVEATTTAPIRTALTNVDGTVTILKRFSAYAAPYPPRHRLLLTSGPSGVLPALPLTARRTLSCLRLIAFGVGSPLPVCSAWWSLR